MLVSHGQPSNPCAGEEYIHALARKVNRCLPNWTIQSATLATEGRLESLLGDRPSQPLIFPVFMADGWFIKSALPARLEKFDVVQLPPLGVHPDLPSLAAELLGQCINDAGWRTTDCEILISAHGSANGRAAADCTYRFADALRRRFPAMKLSCGFLEQEPYLSDIASHCGVKTVELPFFAGSGEHVTEDIPDALNKARFKGIRLPALGQAAAIPALIACTLTHAAQETMAA